MNEQFNMLDLLDYTITPICTLCYVRDHFGMQ